MKNIFCHLLVFIAFCLSAGVALASQQEDKFIIEAYGGSSTKGAMAVRKDGKLRATLTPNNEIAQLNQMLKARYGTEVEIINKGALSAQSKDLLNGRNFYRNNKTWREEMAASPADLILLNFATNDARHYHFKDTESDYIVSPLQYRAIMSELIRVAQQYGKAVIIQEPHPLCGRAEKWNVAPYVAQIDRLARDENVPLVPQYQRIQQIKNWQTLMSPDCIHPSDALYQIKAQETFRVLESHYDQQIKAAVNASPAAVPPRSQAGSLSRTGKQAG
ncbi:lysophospholipase L1-like esterase [Pantoea sp. AN62]|uniref:SGNH/GDSL hydrolase family protein n=1 Tax=Pantoea TaxID=53335 RepID=UPI000B7E51E8|nr:MULTISPECIES: SGNH/GDSL hydrolase family protein [Pantoea]MCQ5471606.1 SGNH/GDSL hydrolase family protein [Pantoea brenneri]MDU4747225.1 SGNH/GDSL hydrolase family protein [Pantoea sp.]OXM20853.1 lipolytic protein G-D-S-L family [Pantoea sp. AV62]